MTPNADYGLGQTCDERSCERSARWALIGESGDLYLCDEHCGDRNHATHMTDKLLVTMTEAGRMLSVGRTTVHFLVKDGTLKVVRIGRSVRLVVADLEEYVRSLPREGLSPIDG